MIPVKISNYRIIYSLLFSVILLTACGRRSMEGMLIITEASVSQGKPDYITGDQWRYIPQTRLVAIDPVQADKSSEILTSGFFSARSPEVSFDGGHLLFTAQKNQNDTWQIWEMDLANLKTRQVTTFTDNSTDPAYLPGDRIVFSRSSQNDSLKAGHILFSCNLDGSDLKRITFNPHSYFASSVLKDGRIISIGREVYPESGDPAIIVLRPDGTKAELFYQVTGGISIISRPWETDNGKLIFIESGNGTGNGRLVAINYNRPLHSRIDLSESLPGSFFSAFPMKSGKLIVSYRANEFGHFALYQVDPERVSLGQPVYSSSATDVIEAVEVVAHERPRKLPSEVDMGVRTGLLLCQNINVTGMNPPSGRYSLPAADRIEIIGLDSSLGIVQVEKDGSFYLKVAADMPFRLKTMDGNGNTVNGPGSWYWLRPNERRGCVGCHEDHEMVPLNRYALAVGKQPVAVPVHVTGIKEKDIELE
jgi:hypothetical protein